MVGIDIVDVNRFNHLVDNDSFLTKYFNKDEIDYVALKSYKEQTLAGLYACKEAFLKATGKGIGDSIMLKDICVLHTQSGAPYIFVNEKISSYLNVNHLTKIECSISHTNTVAVAIVVIS